MQLHVFSFGQSAKYRQVFEGFLALRKRKFVDELGWSLKHQGGLERDQYDRPGALYSIVTRNGQVVAGARALSCGAVDGRWSYMLKDAADGKLDGIPGGLMDVYPSDNSAWECTRFATDEALAYTSSHCIETKLIVAGLCSGARSLGAKKLLSLSSRALGVLLRRFGYQVQRQPNRYLCEDDQREYFAFVMGCDPMVNDDLFRQYAPPLALDHAQELELSGAA
ncbi:acyl-homoserine-lactone synthase [Phaeobacter sp. C3_T13_0]|uniref:acyl-homoserine-lactone synthase n=1 Tax=Phaeobacter cretensis TaxID=3342641 RepID=UPI0039BD1626